MTLYEMGMSDFWHTQTQICKFLDVYCHITYACMVLNNHSRDTSVPSLCPWDEGARAFGAVPSAPGVVAGPSAPPPPGFAPAHIALPMSQNEELRGSNHTRHSHLHITGLFYKLPSQFEWMLFSAIDLYGDGHGAAVRHAVPRAPPAAGAASLLLPVPRHYRHLRPSAADRSATDRLWRHRRPPGRERWLCEGPLPGAEAVRLDGPARRLGRCRVGASWTSELCPGVGEWMWHHSQATTADEPFWTTCAVPALSPIRYLQPI